MGTESLFLPPLTGGSKSPQSITGLHGSTCVTVSRWGEDAVPWGCPARCAAGFRFTTLTGPQRREERRPQNGRRGAVLSSLHDMQSCQWSRVKMSAVLPTCLHECFVCPIILWALSPQCADHPKFPQVDDTIDRKGRLRKGQKLI